jgi:hypothetical protein
LLAGSVAIAAGVVASARWTLQAQDRGGRGQARAKAEAPAKGAAAPGGSIQEALLRPLDLPFAEETTLDEVRQYLARALGTQVILDRAALDRLELAPDDTVRLELKGVRLKVGLKLVLDQVGMTFKVLPEDNLLVLTDPEGSDDPAQRSLSEIKSLHREMHDLQDSVDDLRDLVEEDLGIDPEPPKRKPNFVGERRARPARRLSTPTGVSG